MTTSEAFAGAPMLFHDPDGALVPFEVVADVTPVQQSKADGSVRVQIDFKCDIGAGLVECWACGFKWVALARRDSVRNGGKVECPSCHYKAGWPWDGDNANAGH